MPEYINKQDLLDKAKSLQGSPFGAVAIVREIEKADALEVVHCGKCKYWNKKVFDTIIEHHIGECHCSQWENYYFWYETTDNDFCSYGERGEK